MGVTLVEELPFAHVVSSQFAETVCAGCMKPVWDRDDEQTLRRCTGCKFAHYCDTSCQKKDWSNHKIECKYLSHVTPRVSGSMPRLMGRIITKLQRDGDRTPAFNGRLFASLETHATDIEKDEEKRNGFIAIAHVIKEYLVLADMPPNAQIFEVFCKVLINALVVTDNCLNEIGLAVYLGLSALDHSCNPDAVIIFSGTKATLRTLKRNVTAYSDKLRVQYCDLFKLGPARRETLQKQYYFICDCELCQNFEKDRQKCSLRCTKCNGGFCPYSPDDENPEVRCNACDEKPLYDTSNVKKLFERLMHRGSLEKELDKMIDLYRECQTVFSPYNVPLCNLAEDIMALALESEKFDEAVEHAEKTLLPFRTYYPSGHPALSARTFEYAKLLMLQQNQKCLPVLGKAFEMICESHGPESNFALHAAKMLNNLKQQVAHATDASAR